MRDRHPLRYRCLLPGILLPAALALAWPAFSQPSALIVGQQAPRCLTHPLGNTPGLDWQATRGKVLYVDFWASWCKPCASAFPFLDALQQDYGHRGLQVIGISVDENPADALDFLARHPVSFATVNDPGGACPAAFAIPGMPSSYLIDRQGTVRAIHTGFRDSNAASRRQEIETLLATTTPSP